MTDAAFCSFFPCMCCNCKDSIWVKQDRNPCPDNERVYIKICCFGTPQVDILTWLCCEPEPECKCCDVKPCNTEQCPDPLEKVILVISYSPLGSAIPFVEILYGILARYRGYSCCLEHIADTPWCNSNTSVRVRVCIDPRFIESVKRDWPYTSPDGDGITVSGLDWGDCYCPGK